MDIEVNYKNKKRYKTAKYPMHQGKFWTWLIWFLSKFALMGKKFKVETIGMEELKPPYMLLSNHMHFIDFELTAMATYPHPVSNVVSIDGYVIKFFLLEWIGAIATRKYTTDIHLVKSIRKVLQRGDILAMYPEARYTPCGTLAFMPDSLGKLVKMNKVPVVVLLHHGNYLRTPFWNYRKPRKVPLHTTFQLALTAEQVENMTVEEINSAVKNAMAYDEYRWQKENGIKITEPFRAEGIHKVLYQCPKCGVEHKMASSGAELYCEVCGKRWEMQEDGSLRVLDGDTEFSHIPDWFEWERSQVREQIEKGEYSFSDEVEVYSLPRAMRFENLGKAKLRHNPEEGFVLEGHYRGEDYRIERKPKGMYGVHVEYDYCYVKPFDCIDISTIFLHTESLLSRIETSELI